MSPRLVQVGPQVPPAGLQRALEGARPAGPSRGLPGQACRDTETPTQGVSSLCRQGVNSRCRLTTGRNRRLEPSFKQHTAVDDQSGVVLDVTITTGEVNEGQMLESQVDAVAALTDEAILTVTADAGYAYGKIYGALERRGIGSVIPAKAEPIRSPVPLRRFRYDARHDIVKCSRAERRVPDG